MDFNFLLIIMLTVLFVWLVILTVLYITSVKHYKKLKIGDEKSLENAINTIFRGLEQLHKMLGTVQSRVSDLELKNVQNIQRLHMKRFNPFEETGGNQSFSMAILDGNNDGVVLSSLHARSGTRVYAKPVKSGKQLEHELSAEEQEVINLATKEI